MRPYRSLLFVPGNRPDWARKALDGAADALVLDLEDALVPAQKEASRTTVRAILEEGAGAGKGLFVRINGLETGLAAGDLAAITCSALHGVVIPKVETPEQIIVYGALLDRFEAENGVATGHVEFLLLLETALGIHKAYDLCRASPRVTSIFGGSARDGDISRSIGYTWTREGLETLYLRSKLLLDARAAGIRFPISGTWTDIYDIEGLEAFSRENRQLGYTGMFVIHPAHVEVVNRIFSPSAEEIAYYQEIIMKMEEADAAGVAAVSLSGVMVDIAMVEKAREVLRLARQMGIPSA